MRKGCLPKGAQISRGKGPLKFNGELHFSYLHPFPPTVPSYSFTIYFNLERQ